LVLGDFADRCGVGGDEVGGIPIPWIVRQWIKVGLNRITRHIARGCPASVRSSIVRSGRLYQTPVNMFASEDGYALAPTYGPDTDWLKNVMAEGGRELRARGRVIPVVSPRLFHDEARRNIRSLERQVLRGYRRRWLHVSEGRRCGPADGRTA
jgi:deazaflavin-dependent oxidoreductase (nitroreductase family)